MPTKPTPRSDVTPAGHLVEAGLQQVMGYQLAQAGITTDTVFRAQVNGPLGLRRVEYTLLMLIRENPACSPARLARALNVTAPNITMWVDRLVELGWVTRERNESDRRAQHLSLSPAGAQLAAEATQRLIDGERQVTAALSPGERALLVELLHKVARCRPTK